MAKTTRLSLVDISGWDHVFRALLRACRGKGKRPEVRQLHATPEPMVNRVASCLRAGQMPDGRFETFTVYDPKERVIHAATLADRIAHHAIMAPVEPTFERVLLPTVFACRRHRGVHAAIYHAQKQMRRFGWVMHVDIRHYFPSIAHDILKGQLRRRFRGDGLELLDAIIDSFDAGNGVGLPIGALSSQHFANHYLNDADRWCLQQPSIHAHCRYMDDFLLWANDRSQLEVVALGLADYLAEQLSLAIKPPLIQPTNRWLLYCGTRIKPFALQSGRRRLRRYRRALEIWERRWLGGEIDDRTLQRACDAVMAVLLPAGDYHRASYLHLHDV
ncbi:MAG: RNA-directed DNA polymerase [Gammaproteobacteria bacterium]|nr:RNA-directed DNA polymerase [Gammaproteobacteria bacterium]